jgi:hypothetical protein
MTYSAIRTYIQINVYTNARYEWFAGTAFSLDALVRKTCAYQARIERRKNKVGYKTDDIKYATAQNVECVL